MLASQQKDHSFTLRSLRNLHLGYQFAAMRKPEAQIRAELTQHDFDRAPITTYICSRLEQPQAYSS